MEFKMKVLFENSYGEKREIANVSSIEDCWKAINKFLEKHNYKSYYSRSWKTNDGRTKIDVGSWSEFFYIEDGNMRK